MMKVLFTTNIPSPYRVDFFNELGKKIDLTVLFENEIATDRENMWQLGEFNFFKSVFMKGFYVKSSGKICPEILRYVSNKEFDVIIIGMYSTPTSMIAIQYMKIKKIPFIISSDGGMIREDSKINNIIKKYFIGSASAWLSSGNKTTEYLCHYGAIQDNTYIYPFTSIKENEVLKKKLTYDEKKTQKNKLCIKEENVIISVGQFINRKGFDILIKACSNIDNKIGVYIIGGEPTEEYIHLVNELNITNVHFIGFKLKSDLINYYMAADLFVLPTREDIWGLVINEAMAYGLPVITTKYCVAGMEMVVMNKNGWITEVDSIEISNLINYFFTKCNQSEMSEEALKTARQYTIEKMAISHYESILDFYRCIR